LSFGGVKVVGRKRLGDRRGFLARLFCVAELAEAGWTAPVAQVNHTYTAQRGTVRGMHFQRPPHPETKLVTCLHGEVWDVALDVRLRSLSPMAC
jgi:dTDP-4-dehydrorhamnose 3,5-epimerase